jgi:hypothetical protein
VRLVAATALHERRSGECPGCGLQTPHRGRTGQVLVALAQESGSVRLLFVRQALPKRCAQP